MSRLLQSRRSLIPALGTYPPRLQPRRHRFYCPSSLHQLHWAHASVAAKTFWPSRIATTPPGVLEASSGSVALLAAASFALGSLFYYLTSPGASLSPVSSSKSETVVAVHGPGSKIGGTIRTHATDEMGSDILPGRLGNLTPEQEDKLRQLWASIARVCQIDVSKVEGADGAETAEDDDGTGTDAVELVNSAAPSDGKKKDKKKKRSLFKKSKKDSASTDESVAAVTQAVGTVDLAAVSEDDKYGQGKLFQDALASQSPHSIRDTIWSMVKHDHPDALVLRFLRARKWDVDKALVMLVSTMHWRKQDMHVDDDIMSKGEGGALEESQTTTDEKSKTVSKDFLSQLRMGKSFLHGCDKAGRPICVVRVRLHHQGDQVEESLERCTVYIIETARMVLLPPVDTATIIFDMTGFSMANMDYTPVKFMIKCFEANYPECLGTVLVHKAPWLFQGIWRIIRGWLDPVVAGKVHFTNNVKDMEQFINRSQILKELDGDEDWEYKYLEPEPGENDKMKDTETRDRMLADREKLYRAFEEATAKWTVSANGEQRKVIRAKRDEIAEKMRDDYWQLDPYIRARSVYDRMGMLQPGGKVDFYPQLKKDEITQTNGNNVAQADDA